MIYINPYIEALCKTTNDRFPHLYENGEQVRDIFIYWAGDEDIFVETTLSDLDLIKREIHWFIADEEGKARRDAESAAKRLKAISALRGKQEEAQQ